MSSEEIKEPTIRDVFKLSERGKRVAFATAMITSALWFGGCPALDFRNGDMKANDTELKQVSPNP